MNLLKTQREALLAPLQAVTGIIERRHTLPILSNVLLSRTDSHIDFVATDIEIEITASMAVGEPVEVAARTGSIRDGPAGHPLLSQRPAHGDRTRAVETGCDRRAPAGLRQPGSRGQESCEAGSDPSPQDDHRALET